MSINSLYLSVFSTNSFIRLLKIFGIVAYILPNKYCGEGRTWSRSKSN